MVKNGHNPLWKRKISFLLFCLLGFCAPVIQGFAQTPANQNGLTQIDRTNPHIQELAFSVADWLRLAEAQNASGEEYLEFLQRNPNWPLHRQFSTKLQNALTNEKDLTKLRRLCTSWPLTQAAAFMTCFTRLPPDTELMQYLMPKGIQAWENGNDDPTSEKLLLSTFSSILTPQNHYKRFLRQEKTQHFAAAQDTIPLLAPSLQLPANADLALIRNSDTALGLYLSLPKEDQLSYPLVFHYAVWLRKHKQYQQALSLWQTILPKEEDSHYNTSFWLERDAFARALIAKKDAKDALFLASDAHTRGEPRLDSLFLSGWIALRLLHNPNLAVSYFAPLTQSTSLVTRARGYYWLGCAQAMLHKDTLATAYWMHASLFPTTFYGQVASSRLEDMHNFLLTPDKIPAITATQIRDNLQQESHNNSIELPSTSVQIAQILYATGYQQHIREFLLPQAQSSLNKEQREALANFSLQVGAPDVAVHLARLSTRDGYLLAPQGWPQPYQLPNSKLPPGFVASLIRQESSYNPQSVSYSNAIGLMQMLPGTALEMHRLYTHNSQSHSPNLFDPNLNMKLGSLYLEQIEKRFNNNIPLTAAAYNAGPHRVSTWCDLNGNPTTKPPSIDAMVDWIETIPEAQTRNYVQRVWENMITYHVKETL